MHAKDRSLLSDLEVFVAIVRHGSMTGAAVELGVSTSALSHRMRKLEAALGAQLLNRTSRALSPTEAGAELAAQLGTGFATIEDALRRLTRSEGLPVGRLRLNMLRDAASHLVKPILKSYAAAYPDMHLDLHADDRIVDMVAGGFDAGIRYGDRVPRDMIGVALSPPTRWVVVATPELINRVGAPQGPADLENLPCIEMKLGDDSTFVWELGNGAAMQRITVSGPIRANGTSVILDAAREGLGFAYVLDLAARDLIASGELQVVLPDWASEGPPLMIYYPSRRQRPQGLMELIEMIRQHQGLPPVLGGAWDNA